MPNRGGRGPGPWHTDANGFDYETVTHAIRAALEPMSAQLTTLTQKVDRLTEDHATRGDLEKLREEVQEALSTIKASTYTKSEIDLTLQPLQARLRTLARTLREIQSRNATSTERWVTRAGAVAGLLYMLLQIAPHLAKAFGS